MEGEGKRKVRQGRKEKMKREGKWEVKRKRRGGELSITILKKLQF